MTAMGRWIGIRHWNDRGKDAERLIFFFFLLLEALLVLP